MEDHLETLRWARANGCPWDAWTRNVAAREMAYTDKGSDPVHDNVSEAEVKEMFQQYFDIPASTVDMIKSMPPCLAETMVQGLRHTLGTEYTW